MGLEVIGLRFFFFFSSRNMNMKLLIHVLCIIVQIAFVSMQQIFKTTCPWTNKIQKLRRKHEHIGCDFRENSWNQLIMKQPIGHKT